MSRVAHEWPRQGTEAALFVALLMLAVAGAVAAVERASIWRDHEIRIDGQDDDWRGLTIPVKGQRFALGVMNDGEYLYLCLPTKDGAAKSQITKQGIVVWLDKAGGKTETFGIHFPLALAAGDKSREPSAPAEGEKREAGPPQDAVGILRKAGRDAEIVPLERAGGIEARVGVHADLLVYELKVPLTQDEAHPYAPNVRPGDTLRVQIETASYRGPVAPLGVPSGGVVVGGGRGGIAVGVGVGGGGVTPQFQAPLRLTMNIKLASGPAR